ncbi:MAG: FecR domain-containing protein [Eubacteriales bacterium]|nr:FecR domain-containing protein [Eubacteriales bacterium]
MKNRCLHCCIVPIATVLLLAALLAGCGGGYRSIFVASVTGGVTVARADQSDEITCYEGMKLQDQDIVTAASDGCVILKLDDDKYVYLESGAQIRIYAAGKTGSTETQIELTKGTMSAVIEQKLSANESFRVTVDNVSMVVRGTIFRISRGETESGEPTVLIQTVEGTVGILAEDGAEETLGANLQDVLILTDTGGTFSSTDMPIDYSALKPETLIWIRDALQDKLAGSTDPDEAAALQEILAILNGATAFAAQTPVPTALPAEEPTQTPVPTPTRVPEYTLTLRKSSYGRVTVAEGSYPAGTEIPISAEAYGGFEFNGWMINGESAPSLGMSADTVLVMPNGDTTIGARFRGMKYTLSIEQPAQGGSISGKAGRYAQGEEILLTATAFAGYELTGWLVNGGAAASLGNTPSITFTMPAANRTICAVFSPVAAAHSLTFEQAAQGGGVILLTAGSYTAGTMVPVTVVPETDKILAGLVVNGVLDNIYQGQTSFDYCMPNEDVLLSAVFEIH